MPGDSAIVRGAMPDLADPERALAVAYAPARVRPALAALFAFDERLGGIVGTTSEPMIGLMRLAWWREAVERIDAGPPPAEPLLHVLATAILPCGVTGADLAGIEHGWSVLLDGEMDAAAVARHGRERGGRLFASAAAILDPPPRHGQAIVEAGAGWALADLAHRHSSPQTRAEARRQAERCFAAAPVHWPRRLRPIGMLAALAARDAACDGPRRQGSPTRILQMLALRLTGR